MARPKTNVDLMPAHRYKSREVVYNQVIFLITELGPRRTKHAAPLRQHQ